MTDGLCAPPRRGFFSIFVYTRIILSGQSFRGSSILSATSCRVGACRATANQAKMTSGTTASVAWENLARTGRSQRRLTMSSVFICNQRVSSSGTGAKLQRSKTNAPSARESVPLRARSRRRRLLETPSSFCWAPLGRLAHRPVRPRLCVCARPGVQDRARTRMHLYFAHRAPQPSGSRAHPAEHAAGACTHRYAFAGVYAGGGL